MKNEFYFITIDNKKRIQKIEKKPDPYLLPNTYKVIQRSNLSFKYLSALKKGKKNNYKKISKSFIPNKNFQSILYSLGSAFFIYTFSSSNQIEETKLIPETFIFKGEISYLKIFNLFLFRRESGVEFIFLQKNKLLSFFSFDGGDFLKDFKNFINQIRQFFKERINVLSDDASILTKIRFLSNDNLEIKKKNDFQDQFYLLTTIPDLKIKRVSQTMNESLIHRFKYFIKRWNRLSALFSIIIFIYIIILTINIFVNSSHKNKIEKKYSRAISLPKKIENIGNKNEYLSFLKYKKTRIYRILFSIFSSLPEKTKIMNMKFNENNFLIDGIAIDSLEVIENIKKISGLGNIGFNVPVRKLNSGLWRFSISGDFLERNVKK